VSQLVFIRPQNIAIDKFFNDQPLQIQNKRDNINNEEYMCVICFPFIAYLEKCELNSIGALMQ
jgi:hypothetical protein